MADTDLNGATRIEYPWQNDQGTEQLFRFVKYNLTVKTTRIIFFSLIRRINICKNNLFHHYTKVQCWLMTKFAQFLHILDVNFIF